MAASARFELAKCHSQSVVPYRLATRHSMVEEDGFEPPNHKGTDLQSAAFDHFATPPNLVPKAGIEPATY